MFLPSTLDSQQLAAPDHSGYVALCYAPPEEQILAEVWTMLRRRKFLILGCCAACLLLASLYVLLRSPRYEATARIEVSPAGTNSLGLDQMASRVLSPSDPTIQLQSAVTVLQSSTIAFSVMKQLQMAQRKDFAGPWIQPAGVSFADLPPNVRDALLVRFRKSLSVEVVPKTDIIAVQFRAKDPTLAAEVVNSTVSRYTERNFRSSYESATLVSTWLSKQMDDLRVKAGESQQKLADLQKERGLIGVDLYYRVNTVPLRVPPLRERVQDIPVLVHHFLNRLSQDCGKGEVMADQSAMDALQQYSWPGNIRELRNVLERAVLTAENNHLTARHLQFHSSSHSAQAPMQTISGTLKQMECAYINLVLQDEGGSIDRSARRLGIPRSSLYNKMKRFEIPPGTGRTQP
jgi:capsular polysaccharide biosynthesis protein